MMTTETAPNEPLPDNAPHVLVVDDDQKIRDLLSRYLNENGFRVTPAADAAAARAAMHEAYGKPAQEIGAGGSIPLIDSLRAAVPGAEILLFGAQDPMARIHAPNESVDLAELEKAVLAQTLFLQNFGLSKDR